MSVTFKSSNFLGFQYAFQNINTFDRFSDSLKLLDYLIQLFTMSTLTTHFLAIFTSSKICVCTLNSCQ